MVLWDEQHNLISCDKLLEGRGKLKLRHLFLAEIECDSVHNDRVIPHSDATCIPTTAEFANLELPAYGTWHMTARFSCRTDNTTFLSSQKPLKKSDESPCNGRALSIPLPVATIDEEGATITPDQELTTTVRTNEKLGLILGIVLGVFVLGLPVLLFFIMPWWHSCVITLQESCPCFEMRKARKIKRQIQRSFVNTTVN
ncbi:hypothetical protein BLNAU_3538 [Blattamonas nauphoetae]|uniref:Uncharacterized protein n=1 Tax=Blattamonas nauphoetae TaxID=2049346 RepID=A0ABQ9YCE7_9EUKA|nr:hypothetical protein BLNAU_3538 [Blattamonas nauphoetae]